MPVVPRLSEALVKRPAHILVEERKPNEQLQDDGRERVSFGRGDSRFCAMYYVSR